MEIIEWSGEKIERPLVVVGFPSQGLVGGIASNYLIHASEMWLAATIHDDELPPMASIRSGRVLPPFQIWAGAQRCGVQGECDQLVIVRADAVPDVKLSFKLASAILSWAQAKDAKLVVSLEGTQIGTVEATQQAFAVGTPEAAKALEASKLPQLPEGNLSGLTGALLVKGIERGLPVAAFLVDSRADIPDAKSAAALVGHLDPLLPSIPLEPEPLFAQAQVIEKQMRESIEDQRRAMTRLHDSVMYH